MASFDLNSEANARTVLVASTGGHLAQLVRLSRGFRFATDPLWITFESPQSRSLLRGCNVRFVDYVPPRGYRELLRAFRQVRPILQANKFDVAISTGAALALAVLPFAAATRRPAVYIESVSRFDGPSITGRAVAAIPGIDVYTQHSGWSSARWRLGPSVLTEYSVRPGPTIAHTEPFKVFVTLGTIRPYHFRSLLDRLTEIIPPSWEVVWQVGETPGHGLRGTVLRQVSASAFDEYVRSSDIVVTHAGVGSTMRILDLGKQPVVVPRRRDRGEHVDDHQLQVARELGSRGIVVHAEVEELSVEMLLSAAGARVFA